MSESVLVAAVCGGVALLCVGQAFGLEFGAHLAQPQGHGWLSALT